MKLVIKTSQANLWRTALNEEQINYRVGRYVEGAVQDRFRRYLFINEPISKREIRRIQLKYGLILPQNKRDWKYIQSLKEG